MRYNIRLIFSSFFTSLSLSIIQRTLLFPSAHRERDCKGKHYFLFCKFFFEKYFTFFRKFFLPGLYYYIGIKSYICSLISYK